MDKKKNENFFLKLVKIKKEIRNCVENGRDLKDVEKNKQKTKQTKKQKTNNLI